MGFQRAVLSIDGGGIKGIVPAMILAKIEEETQKPICQLFDLIAGTSTGGILTLGLTKPSEKDRTKPKFTAKQLVDLYVKQGKIIFQGREPEKSNFDNNIINIVKELGNLYIEQGKGIFQGRELEKSNFDNAKENLLKAILNKFLPQIEAEDLFSSKHSRKGKKKVINDYLKDTYMKEALAEILITSYSTNFRKPIFFTSNSQKEEEYKTSKLYRVICEGYTMENAALATSAAPTYFKPYWVDAINHPDKGYTLVDGGVFANNPTSIAIIEAMNSYKAKKGKNIPLDELLVVSLGTGRKARGLDIDEIANWGQIKWIEPLIDITLNGQSEVVDYQMEQLLSAKLQRSIQEQQYYRFQPQYSEIKNSKHYSMGENDLIYVNDKMDDASTDNIDNLVEASQRFINKEIYNLKRLSNELSKIVRSDL
ncbi:patatin-like phospholipase family protein (plasmid) [Nostoc sp. UHCC 0302]|uniref:patatin-like phospholipase family protein n=1 Tax=Nostoc sp. UHCC 0302 TaxID=3134896 RepID=UPI00311CD855